MNRSDFFIQIRKNLFISRLLQTQVDGLTFILDEAEKRNTPMRHLAYILATAYHETARTMQPIAEYGKGRGHAYGSKGKYGQAQYGRGFVQLTWDANYEKADKELGLNGALLKDFDLALDPKIATQILFSGMEKGWFTGRKLSDYLDGPLPDYPMARHIINGMDKSSLIASYANEFSAALTLSRYGATPPVDVPAREETTPKPPIDAPAVPEREKPLTYGTAPVPKVGWLDVILAVISTIIKGWKR